MKRGPRTIASCCLATGLSVWFVTAAASGQTGAPTSGPARDGTPAWFLQGSFPDPVGNTSVDAEGNVTVLRGGRGAPPPVTSAAGARPTATPNCSRAPICGNRLTPGRNALQRVQFEQTLGYTFTYPYVLPPGTGGVPAVARDSKGHLWVFQRKPAGMSQLFKFDANHRIMLEVAPDVIGYQEKAHGMAVDAADNVWIVDTNGATVMKLSPEGRLLMTIGERGRRGDWDEARGLLVTRTLPWRRWAGSSATRRNWFAAPLASTSARPAIT